MRVPLLGFSQLRPLDVRVPGCATPGVAPGNVSAEPPQALAAFRPSAANNAARQAPKLP